MGHTAPTPSSAVHVDRGSARSPYAMDALHVAALGLTTWFITTGGTFLSALKGEPGLAATAMSPVAPLAAGVFVLVRRLDASSTWLLLAAYPAVLLTVVAATPVWFGVAKLSLPSLTAGGLSLTFYCVTTSAACAGPRH